MYEMDTLLTPPLTLLKQAWSLALTKSNRFTYVTLGTIPVALSFGFSALTSYFITTTSDLETILTNILNNTGVWGILGLIALVVIGFVISVLIGTWYTALLYKVYQGTATNKSMQLFQYLKPAKHVTMLLLKTSLRVGCMALLGFLLFIIPGIIITVRYAFAPLISTSEDCAIKPIEESKRLVKDRFWKLVSRSLIPFLLYSIPLSLFQSLHPLLGTIWSISSPVFGLYFFLVYLDFKRTAPASA